MQFSPIDHVNCQYLGCKMFKMDISKKQIGYFPAKQWLGTRTNQSTTSNGLKNGLWGFGKSAGFEKRPLLGQSMVDFRFLGQFSTRLFKQKKISSKKWPPEGSKLSYSICRNRGLSRSLGTQYTEVPTWKGPQKFLFFSTIIVSCGTLLKAVAKVIQYSKMWF